MVRRFGLDLVSFLLVAHFDSLRADVRLGILVFSTFKLPMAFVAASRVVELIKWVGRSPSNTRRHCNRREVIGNNDTRHQTRLAGREPPGRRGRAFSHLHRVAWHRRFPAPDRSSFIPLPLQSALLGPPLAHVRLCL
ncbi:uncharacterized protein B0T23DRAFT_386437 [Neurospora hispaniola]|uniref:Uncharacterized protein n=1 Tax=Neurospora hispaniola TaxID=588809 RepID=A0AAJ0I228_9PEZI|nr:hypothetical protein B0T23DRAFT_386437 [Neurospora hispaniola]